jgi:hypothetical protein
MENYLCVFRKQFPSQTQAFSYCRLTSHDVNDLPEFQAHCHCLGTVISRKQLVQQCRGVLDRRLGLQYLRVDALYIIQDNEDDWRRESQMMVAIYGNALLAVAASCAESPTDGFLSSRQRSISHRAVALQPGKLFLCQSLNLLLQGFRGHWAQPPQKRAWAWQERLLNPKMVSFGHDQILWGCRSERYLESLTEPHYTWCFHPTQCPALSAGREAADTEL